MKKISIIMPFRNAMPYLEECLDSILDQTYENWELNAVNDHSEDGSYDLLLKYVNKDQRIRCFQNTGRGIIDALCTGYKHSTGEFVTRMDADDIMPSIKLTQLHQLLLDEGKGKVATGRVKYISETVLGDGFIKYQNWLNQLCDNNNHYSEIYKECVIPSPCWMMYRTDFEAIGGFASESYPEDYDLVFRMYEHGIKVIPSNEVLHIWRDHSDRASRNDENYSDNRFLKLKVNYFLRNDFREDDKLILWGAGKKGKQIAQLLLDSKIDFEWVTNNDKKIGKHIYAQMIKDSSMIDTSSKNLSLILAVANEDDQKEILSSISYFSNPVRLFKFC